MKITAPYKIRPKTTPVLEALKTHKVFSDIVMAVQAAKELYKSNNRIRLYETPTGKYIATTEEMEYKELKFKKMSTQELRSRDEHDLYDSHFILKSMRGQHA